MISIAVLHLIYGHYTDHKNIVKRIGHLYQGRHKNSGCFTGVEPRGNFIGQKAIYLLIYLVFNGLFIIFTGNFSSSPKAFIGDPMFLRKSLDSRSEALRE